MAAHWRLLTEYLVSASDDVWLTWPELDAIVGGLPASAIDHYPQWWHGDRPNTRAWRAAGYEAQTIDPGISVLFVRTVARSRATEMAPPPRRAAPTPAVTASVEPSEALHGLNPARCLLVVPCSASKRKGGRRGQPAPAPADLVAARRDVLEHPDSHTDDSLVMPAWQRYDGYLYRAARPALSDPAATDRLLILSGGYGVLEGRDPIGNYNRMMRSSDWPRGLLEQLVADRAAQSRLDVVAFAGSTTDYAKLLRRARWQLPEGRAAQLVTLRGVRGVSAVSSSLGLALRAFMALGSNYPQGTIVERLDA